MHIPYSAKNGNTRSLSKSATVNGVLEGGQLGSSPLGIGIDEGLLVDAPHALVGADIEGIRAAQVAGMRRFNLAMGNMIFLLLLSATTCFDTLLFDFTTARYEAVVDATAIECITTLLPSSHFSRLDLAANAAMTALSRLIKPIAPCTPTISAAAPIASGPARIPRLPMPATLAIPATPCFAAAL